jgi:cytochrome c553
MKKSIGLFAFALIPIAAYAADATQDWAFLTPGPDAPAPAAPPGGGGQAARPEVPAGVPAIVAQGKGQDVRPCSTCHTPSGMGQPESANLRGLPVNYFIAQMRDFASGARKGPRAGAMANFAKNMSDDEISQVAMYYAAMKPASWTIVNETDVAPKTVINKVSQRVRVADGGVEAVGPRIVEFAQTPAAPRTMDSNAFIAFTPTGSLFHGRELVADGDHGKTTPCAQCHGDSLQGMGDVPGIAGRSPVYIARQLYTFKNNDRNGPNADMMKQVVAKLDNDEIVAIAAYVGSRNPS